ncbi:MAG: sterol desaturase family protein, partial [Chromatiales bacterium]|nr:sterol desaturase family protein [Chromatiales bacterium]
MEFIHKYETTIRLGVFLGSFCLLAFLEWLNPRRLLTQKKIGRWLNNFSLVVLGAIAIRLIFPVAAVGTAYLIQQNHFGLIHYFDPPYWLAVVVSIALLDLSVYFQHVIFHIMPILWRFHRVHHSDLDCDVSTGIRFHPIEIILSMVIKIVFIIMLGVPVLAVIIFEVVLNLMSMFTHSNIRINKRLDSVLRWFLVTPDMHRIHHSARENETNSNFCFHLSIWDRLFGTYLEEPRNGHDKMVIGLDQFRESKWQNLSGLLYLPFTSHIGGYAVNYRDTINADELELARELAIKNREKAELASELASYIEAIGKHALVSITDRNGKIIEVNDKFCEVSGY